MYLYMKINLRNIQMIRAIKIIFESPIFAHFEDIVCITMSILKLQQFPSSKYLQFWPENLTNDPPK